MGWVGRTQVRRRRWIWAHRPAAARTPRTTPGAKGRKSTPRSLSSSLGVGRARSPVHLPGSVRGFPSLAGCTARHRPLRERQGREGWMWVDANSYVADHSTLASRRASLSASSEISTIHTVYTAIGVDGLLEHAETEPPKCLAKVRRCDRPFPLHTPQAQLRVP